MSSATVGSLDLARRHAMARFEEGEIPQAEAALSGLIASVNAGTPGAGQLLYYLHQDRATVRRRANDWDAALVDLAAAERLIDGLSPLFHDLCRSAIAQARALIWSEPANPRHDPVEAGAQIERMRQTGYNEFAADDIESRLAYRAGDWTRAASLARRAAKALDEQGWPGAAATCRRRAADALIAGGDLAGAEAELEASRQQIDRFGTPVDLAHAELAHARLHAAHSEHDEAWARTLKALAQFDNQIHRFSVLTEQQKFLADKLDHYADAFAIALKAGGDNGCLRAWSVAERSKSFYLCQILASADVPLFEGVSPDDVRALRDADEELDRLERKYGNLGDSARDSDAGRDLLSRLRAASQHKAETLRRLMRASDRWARVNVPGAFDMAQQLTALPEGWSFLSYYWERSSAIGQQRPGAGRLHLFWTDGSKRPRHLATEWTHEDLDQLRKSRAGLKGRVPMDAPFPDALSELILPGELCRTIPADFNVVISPHGLLQLLPIHALVTDTDEYAAGRWAIQYLPTFALLPLVRSSAAKEPVLLLGCEQDGFGDGPLTAVPAELRTLEASWTAAPARRADPFLIPADGLLERTDARVSNWERYGVIHVACHGVFPAGRPFDAALRLGSSSVSTTDFFGVRLDGAVVSFSACALGRHEERLDERAVVGDEWIGLSLPLLYAGVRCIVASLWDAYSEPAASFMQCLHIALKRGDEPAAAVRWAQDRTASEVPPPPAWANWYAVGLPPLNRRTP